MVDLVVDLIALIFLAALVVTCAIVVYAALVETFPNALWLCAVGLHRLEHVSAWGSRGYETWSRCRRDGCECDQWQLVDVVERTEVNRGR